MKSILLSALLVVLVFASPFLNAQAIAQAAASDEADVEALVEAHTANGRIQSERPTFEPEPDEGTPRRNNHIIEAIGKFFAWIFQNFGWLIRYLLIGAVVAVVAYALWYMLGGLTLPGPFTMSQQAQNDFYSDPAEMALDYAAAVNEEIRDLFAAGADDIAQFDLLVVPEAAIDSPGCGNADAIAASAEVLGERRYQPQARPRLGDVVIACRAARPMERGDQRKRAFEIPADGV